MLLTVTTLQCTKHVSREELHQRLLHLKISLIRISLTQQILLQLAELFQLVGKSKARSTYQMITTQFYHVTASHTLYCVQTKTVAQLETLLHEFATGQKLTQLLKKISQSLIKKLRVLKVTSFLLVEFLALLPRTLSIHKIFLRCKSVVSKKIKHLMKRSLRLKNLEIKILMETQSLMVGYAMQITTETILVKCRYAMVEHIQLLHVQARTASTLLDTQAVGSLSQEHKVAGLRRSLTHLTQLIQTASQTSLTISTEPLQKTTQLLKTKML